MDDDETADRGPLPACLTQGLTEAPVPEFGGYIREALRDVPASIQDQLLKMLGADDDDGDEPEDVRQALALLAAIGVERVEFQLEGGGDEGTASTAEVVYADGRSENDIPDLPVGFSANGGVTTVAEILEEHAAEAPDFNWVDNAGGSGTVTYLPLGDPGERIEVDMCYHEEGGDDDDDDDDEDVDIDEDEDDADTDEEDPDAITIGDDD